MSLSFDFQADFSATADTLRKQVVALLGDSVVSEDGFLRISESLDVVIDSADADDTDITMELYGFRENVDAYFTLSKSNPDTGNIQMWNIVLYLLATHEGDAVFLFNSDIVMLLRRGGEMTLNQDWDWDGEPSWLMSRLPADLTIKSIPVA